MIADNWLNLKRIELTVYVDNAPGHRPLRAHGFEVEGTHRAFAFRDGAFVRSPDAIGGALQRLREDSADRHSRLAVSPVRCAPNVRPQFPGDPTVLHVSTRGEAPAIGFTDALLTGLARDGGLYVPQAGRHSRQDAIQGFAGRPYAEVAKAVLGPLVAGDIADGRPRSDDRRGLCAPSAIRRSAR